MPTPDPNPQPKQPNGTAALLTTLAQSGNQWVQLGTLLCVGIAGIGNWVATWNSSDRNKQEIEISRRVNWESNEKVRQEVIKQVGDIHDWMRGATEEFHKGNEDSAANRRTLNQVMREDLEGFERRQQAALDNQNRIMASQTKILENDAILLREIHTVVEKFDKWKQLEQQRGAPP